MKMSGECHQIAYKSRFMQDFEPVRKIIQLDPDRVVFEARKRTDLVHYAVERIRLPEFKKDRNEVVRKAKVLTCLNHRNLVRCFHCWTEDPPNGWQDSQDHVLFSTDDEMNKPSFATIFGGSKANQKNDSSSRLGGKPSPISINKEAVEWYLYIQMELVHKAGFISLDKWLLEGHQEGEVLTLFVAGILQAVEHLHSKGLIHQDLKPSNIFLNSRDKTVKVGHVKLLVNDEDQVYSPKMDVYSLGLILIQLLIKSSERNVIIEQLEALPMILPNLNIIKHPEAKKLLVKMLAFIPEDRPELKDVLTNPWIAQYLPKPDQPIINRQGSLVEKKRYKILVIGDQNTGKTSIIYRYVKGEFIENQQLTVGPGISCKEVSWENDLIIKLEFCDIGGEERNRFMTSAFYRRAVGALVVMDVTQPDGFQAATLWKKDLDLKLRIHDDGLVPSVLLINKCDGDGKRLFNSEEYDPTQVDRYCRTMKFSGWFDTSAKNDININEAILFLLGKVLANEANNVQETDDSISKLDESKTPIIKKNNSRC